MWALAQTSYRKRYKPALPKAAVLYKRETLKSMRNHQSAEYKHF